MNAALPEGLFADAALATREREYSPSSCIGGDYGPYIEAYRTRSQQARQEAAARGGRWSHHAVGTGATPALELCVPGNAQPARAGPLLLFVHGGYWQELSAADSLFAAAACIRRGVAFAALDYTLAPAADLSAIVDECAAALSWLAREGPALGIDPRRIVVAGSSAGAHLAAAMAQCAVVEPALARPAALVLVSGIYWLEPLIGTSIDGALRLTPATARAASPGLASLRGLPTTLVAWGDNETPAFKAQSRQFAARLRTAGVACSELQVPGRNHFDIVFDLCEAPSGLGAFAFDRLAARG